jgi:hypothetical protein
MDDVFVPGGDISIRMTPGDDPRASIIDYVMYVTRSNKNDAGKVITRIQNSKNGPFFIDLQKHQFKGSGEKKQFVLGASECIDLLMILPGQTSIEFRRHIGGLLNQLFKGDPLLHDTLDKYKLTGDATKNLLLHLAVAAPDIMARKDAEESVHNLCRDWICDNVDSISFAATICPTCEMKEVGLCLKGGVAKKEEVIPNTSYRADVLVMIPAVNIRVAVEVAHTHFTSMKRAFECEEHGTKTCEVETCEVQAAMLRHSNDSFHVLRSTHTRSVVCAGCAFRDN